MRARGGRHVHDDGAGARRQGSGLCARRCGPRSRDRESGRWRVLQFRASPAAGSSASMCTRPSTTRFVDGFVESDRQVRARQSDGREHDARARWCAHRRPSSCGSRRPRRVAQGARAPDRLRQRFPPNRAGTPYLAPQVLVDVDHSMRVMTEESFGPVVGIMKVKSDDEAMQLMNDSALRSDGRHSGPAIVEAARAHRRSGRDRDGVHEPLRLSRSGAGLDRREGYRARLHAVAVGYEMLTRPKSFHLRHQRI